jgi:nucleoside-diphosphate-sugar epimerase
MRVVVVGATGNAGTALLRSLAGDERVTSVLGIARRLPHIGFPKTEWVAADISRDELVPHFSDADCVVHLAWLIQPSRDRETTWRTNVHGSRRVFDAIAAAKVPALVYASSVGAYSPGPKDRAVDESWPTQGIASSFYSRDKADVERMLDAFERRQPDVRVVRLRPSILAQRAMGTEAMRLFTGPLVPRRLVAPGRIPIVPDLPGLRFQVTHSDDVADAYHRSVVGQVHGPFNVAAEPVLDPEVLAEVFEARRIRIPPRLARTVVALTWRAHLQPTPEGWLDMALQTPLLDTTRARAELGWAPRHTSVAALVELVQGFHDGAGAPTPPLRPA